MRRLPVLLAALALLAYGCNTPAPQSFTYTNPILHLDYSDPDAIRVGDDYWMTASSFNCFPGLPILHSRDLVHWELVNYALTDYPCDGSDDDFRTQVHHGKAVWAPAIRYHDGWYYIYVGDPDRGIFMVRTQDPAGAWEKPVWVVREKGFIDPCPLWDDDGRAWLSHGCAGSRAGLKSVLFVAPLSADGTRLEGPSHIVYDGHATQPTIEGTKFYKRNGLYYIFAPAGGVSTGWQTVLRGTSPYGPFEEKIVMASAPGTINGPHQGAWVSSADGSDWFIHFQDKGAYGRIVHLQPLFWGDDDWPLIGEDPDGDGVGQPVARFKAPGAEALSSALLRSPVRVNAPERASAPGTGLPLEWQYPAIPSPYWHMALPDGCVRLYSVYQDWQWNSLWDSPNVLQQKFPAERFTVTAKLSFRPNPQLKGETAGFVVMGNDYAGLKLTDTYKGAQLQFILCQDASKGASEQALDITVLPETVVWVKLEVRPMAVEGNVPDAVCRFLWSLDGKRFTPAGTKFTAKPELWTGAKFGFFCNRFTPKNDSGCLDVTCLKVKPEYAPLEGFIYDEENVPEYTLPDVLTFQNGKKVKSVRDWEKRRKELLNLFETQMYGTAPGRPAQESFELLESGPAFDGLAIRKQVRVHLGDGEYQDLLMYLPAGVSNVPVFLGINFFGNHTICADPYIALPDSLRYRRDYTLDARGSQAHRWPVETIVKAGFGIVTFCCEDIAPDSEDECCKRVRGHYPGYTWGNIAAWAWGLSRAMDYLETDSDVSKVAVFGHSRMGKAAVWASAKDTRFAMLVSNASGCGGAAISRRCFGETIRRITTHYPYWFTSAFSKYGDNEDLMPFDQHEALALTAPRPLYVESGTEDRWSDPRGEFLSLEATAPVYALYGFEEAPTGYHIRPGKHEILEYDWERYLDFAKNWLYLYSKQ
ncbi:MAG: glycoside hydrolase 43 family protein [Bacteroidales bacterium]|nr:glycoside hydrolase 43 family protein [Bacteroidales bacterium]